ncbi:hypothetical protein LSAT2_000816 [Lamellibrachia satsuma]|nr:hypothetical protein LSAT2_000816 [Lamellibrachia satsuma]
MNIFPWFSCFNILQHVRKQSSHCSRKRSQNKFPNVGVFSTKSTPAVRTRDYSAFCSTEYHRPTPLVNSAMTSTTSYLQKIVRKSTERLSGIMHRAQRQDCSTAERRLLSAINMESSKTVKFRNTRGFGVRRRRKNKKGACRPSQKAVYQETKTSKKQQSLLKMQAEAKKTEEEGCLYDPGAW